MRHKYIHFSIDDFFDTLWDLGTGEYEDIFEQPLLKFLKRIHDQYGCTFSGYCFLRKEQSEEVSDEKDREVNDVHEEGRRWMELSALHFSDGVREQFHKNTDWLKLGFHALDKDVAYGHTHFTVREYRETYEQAREDCLKMHDILTELCGGPEILDLVPRIHYFAGSSEALRAWKDSGIQGVLSADDDRLPYDLSKEEMMRLKETYYLDSPERGLYIIRTALRLEKTEDAATVWQALTDAGRLCIEIFTHEYFMDEPGIRERFETFAQLAKENDYTFAFSQETML